MKVGPLRRPAGVGAEFNTTGKGRPTHSLRPGSAPPHRLSLPSRAGEDESHHASKQNRAKEKQYAGFLSQLWPLATDRKSVVKGKSVSVRVDLGGRRIIKKKKE